jgi:Tol biopolymer transport system component
MKATCKMSAILLTIVATAVSFGQGRAREQARDENFAVFVSQRDGADELYLLDLDTRQVSQLTKTGRSHINPSVSQDSGMIVFAAREGGSYELFCGSINAARRTRRPAIERLNRLTINPVDETSPSMTEDGKWIAFSSSYGIEVMTSNGAGRRVVAPVSERYSDFNPAISPDGEQIALVSNRSGDFELWLLSRSSGELRQLTNGAAALGSITWSGDSKWIAFTTSATSTRLDGIAVAGAESGQFRVLTENNDRNPSLSATGDRVIFTSMRDGDAELYLLKINTGEIERLTRSLGVDDGAVFLYQPVLPKRK